MLTRWWRSLLRADRTTRQTEAVADPDDQPLGPDEDPFESPVVIGTGPMIDLHAIPPSQSRLVVAEYLREARSRGYRCVRIVHGKGIGAQRRMVREVLASTPFVISFTDAPPEAGGWGATIVIIAEQESIGDSNYCQVE